MKLYTTDEQFDNLHLMASSGRGKQVQVRRHDLVNLLMDHGNFVNMANRWREPLEPMEP